LLLEQSSDVAARMEGNDPQAGAVYHTLAMVYLDRRERYDEAESLLERASAIAANASGENSAEYAGSRAQLACLVDCKGESDRAISLYREAFRVYETAPAPNPVEHAAFLSDAGHLYLRLGRHEDAQAAFLQSLQLRQSLPEIDASVLARTTANLAVTHFELGDFPGAIRHYRHAVDLWFPPSTSVPRSATPEAPA
jgi:tetratricopeptide (TPR) repeat protein